MLLLRVFRLLFGLFWLLLLSEASLYFFHGIQRDMNPFFAFFPTSYSLLNFDTTALLVLDSASSTRQTFYSNFLDHAFLYIFACSFVLFVCSYWHNFLPKVWNSTPDKGFALHASFRDDTEQSDLLSCQLYEGDDVRQGPEQLDSRSDCPVGFRLCDAHALCELIPVQDAVPSQVDVPTYSASDRGLKLQRIHQNLSLCLSAFCPSVSLLSEVARG